MTTQAKRLSLGNIPTGILDPPIEGVRTIYAVILNINLSGPPDFIVRKSLPQLREATKDIPRRFYFEITQGGVFHVEKRRFSEWGYAPVSDVEADNLFTLMKQAYKRQEEVKA